MNRTPCIPRWWLGIPNIITTKYLIAKVPKWNGSKR